MSALLFDEAAAPPRDRRKRRSVQRNNNRWHGSQDWYTPESILCHVRAFLGDYYDPCPPSYGAAPVINGLLVPWRGRSVFCNPPYGRAIRAWVAKAMLERTTDLLLLVPASTDTGWFAPLLRLPLCFVRGRIQFDRPGGASAHAPHPSVIAYRGRRVAAFADEFSALGPVLRPYWAIKGKQTPLPWIWEQDR